MQKSVAVLLYSIADAVSIPFTSQAVSCFQFLCDLTSMGVSMLFIIVSVERISYLCSGYFCNLIFIQGCLLSTAFDCCDNRNQRANWLMTAFVCFKRRQLLAERAEGVLSLLQARVVALGLLARDGCEAQAL